ncbi:PREDICTED: uncharacterized protein LOC109234892 [Nicotiana attenuata]|uniref:uncharacterized protein LOC109234892 n=1 Tax=Nicotiana attenuata TaxID=49451 RepID=UPI00090541B5|nr:PREDICTED: uncharacterized protein LOC109234892 [Nicotiana attenuata]
MQTQQKVTNLQSTGNTPPSHAFSMDLQVKEAIENMLSIAGEGVIIEGGEDRSEPQGEASKTLVEGPDPFSEDPTQGFSQEPQVSTDPAPTPHFYAEPLYVVVLEMRSVFGEEHGDSEEDFVATPEPTPKPPITRLQKKDALESAHKKSQVSQRRRKLVKDGKAVHDKVVHVVTVDDEVDEEPGSLTHKSSQKHSLSKSKEKSLVSIESPNKSDDVISSENLVKESGDKIVEESGGRYGNKGMEDVGEHVKVDVDEEPGSPKKAKIGDPQSTGKEKLKNQKVLRGCTFAPNILEEAGMRQLVEICEFQQWTHLFTGDSPKVYEEEVRSYYADFFKVDDDHICMMVNGVDFVMDFAVLGSILNVPAKGLSIVQGSCTPNFRNAIVKDKAVQQGERVHKKALLSVYQLLFEMVNKVFLPHAERRSMASIAYLVLIEALDGFTTINLPGIMIEHMQKVAEFKDGNHGMPYGFLLTKVFELFKVPLGQAKNNATEEIRKLKARNVILDGQLSQLQEALGSSSSQSSEVARMTKENVELKKQVEDLKEKLLNEQMSANDRMDLVLQTLASTSKPSPSSAP